MPTPMEEYLQRKRQREAQQRRLSSPTPKPSPSTATQQSLSPEQQDYLRRKQRQQQQTAALRERDKAIERGALTTFSNITRPFQMPGDVTRAFLEDVSRGDGFGRTFGTLGEAGRYLGGPLNVFGAKVEAPSVRSSGRSLLDSWGVKDAPTWLSVATEFFVDPFSVGTLLGAGARVASLSGRAAQAANLSSAAQKLRKVSVGLDDAAKATDRFLSPSTAVNAANRGVKALTGRDPVEAVYKGFWRAMETSSPVRRVGAEVWSQPWLKSEDATLARSAKELQNYSWGELLFPAQADNAALRQAAQRGEGTGHMILHRVQSSQRLIEQKIMEAVGSEKVGLGAPITTLRRAGEAAGQATGIGKVGAVAGSLGSDIFAGKSTKIIKGFRDTKIPKATETFAARFRQLTGGWADDIGDAPDGVVADILATPDLPTALRRGDLAPQIQKAVSKSTVYREKLGKLGEQYAAATRAPGMSDRDYARYLQESRERFQRTGGEVVQEVYRTTAFVGSQLVQWDKFDAMAGAVAQRLGTDKRNVIRSLILEAQKPDADRFLSNNLTKPDPGPPALPSAGPTETPALAATNPLPNPVAERTRLEADLREIEQRVARQRGQGKPEQIQGSRTGLRADQIRREIDRIDISAANRIEQEVLEPAPPNFQPGLPALPGRSSYQPPRQLPPPAPPPPPPPPMALPRVSSFLEPPPPPPKLGDAGFAGRVRMQRIRPAEMGRAGRYGTGGSEVEAAKAAAEQGQFFAYGAKKDFNVLPPNDVQGPGATVSTREATAAQRQRYTQWVREEKARLKAQGIEDAAAESVAARRAREMGLFRADFYGDNVQPPLGWQTPPPLMTEAQMNAAQQSRDAELRRGNRAATAENSAELRNIRRQNIERLARERQAERRSQYEEKLRQDFAQRQEAQLDYNTRQALATAFKEEGEKLGLGQFSTVDPFEYMRGLQTGYLRRTFNLPANPADIKARLVKGDSGLVKGQYIDQPEDMFAAARSTLGTEGEQAVRDVVATSTLPVLKAVDIELAMEAKGVRPDPAKIREFIRSVNPDAQVMDRILEKLGIKENAWQRGGQGLDNTLERRLFAERKVNGDVYRALLDEQQDVTARLGDLGLSGARAVTPQTLNQYVYDTLSSSGQLISREDYLRLDNGVKDGLKYVLLPGDTELWGGLANTAIPLPYARAIANGIGYADTKGALTAFQKLASIPRAGWLAAPTTLMTNIIGNEALMYSAGVNLASVKQYAIPAIKAALEYRNTGYSKVYEGVEDSLRFLADGGLSADLNVSIREALELYGGKKKEFDWIDFAREISNRMAKTAPIGTLHFFQFAEDAQRTMVYMWSKAEMAKRGRVAAEDIRDAAHFANNALYDYSNVGVLVDMLRKSGLGTFPAYAYFTTGRVGRLAYENPAALARPEKAISALSDATTPNDEEDKINRMYADLQGGHGRYYPVPGGKEGEYYLVDLSKYLPAGIFTPQNIGTMINDPLTGGVWRPLVEVGMAFWNGDGKAPYSGRFGRNVFQPYEEPLQKVTSAANFLRQSYQPTIASMVERNVQDLPLTLDAKQAQFFADRYGRWSNTEPQQKAAQFVGLRNQKVSTADSTSYRSALTTIVNEARDKSQAINEEFNRRVRRNGGLPSQEDINWYNEWQVRLANEQAARIQKLQGNPQGPGGNR